VTRIAQQIAARRNLERVIENSKMASKVHRPANLGFDPPVYLLRSPHTGRRSTYRNLPTKHITGTKLSLVKPKRGIRSSTESGSEKHDHQLGRGL